jgi:acyl-CoA synthetase (NDP forming)
MAKAALTDAGRRVSLKAMLEARTVAVVGGSPRTGSFGEQMMVQLAAGGYRGTIYPVNPRYPEVMGHRCFSSIEEVPEAVDLAILGVSNAMLEEQLRAAAKSGARSAVIFASCFEPPGSDSQRLTERLTDIARAAGMALCGGNGMGFINFEQGLRACGFSEPEDLEPGAITFVTHSGSAFSALLHNDRGLRFNLAVSSGLELVTTAGDYIHYALSRERTRLIALFLETVRDPDVFVSALRRAAELDVPVVALKVGRTRRAKELVTAHSGALAGEDGAYEAVFDAFGVLRVETLDEMADTLELFVTRRRAASGGLAAIHDSGGERVHLMDLAAMTGVRLAEISDETKARLSHVLEDGLAPVNPLDAWGTGNDADRIFADCMRALLDDPDTAALSFCVDLTSDPVPEGGYKQVARDVFAGTKKPVAVLGNMAGAIDHDDARYIRQGGVPVLEGTVTGLAAFRHLFEYRDFRDRPPAVAGERSSPGTRERWIARFHQEGSVDEVDALALLADYGIPAVRAERAGSEDEAATIAHRLGWPVVLKTSSRDVPHKSEVDGVRLNLRSEHELREAHRDMTRRLGPTVTVSTMAPPGVELALGVVRDEQFGPLAMVAAGGTLVEVLQDRRFALPPVDRSRALALLDRLAIRAVLGGVRGAPPIDLGAVAEAIVSLSVVASELGEHLAELDVNPLICGPSGCVAADALVITRESR